MRIVSGLDLETTGLSQPDGHRIIEVALRLYNLDTAQFLGRFVSRVNPQRSIDPGAQAVHGITFDQLTAEPLWEAVAPRVVQILAKSTLIVAHNGLDFDFPFLFGELIRVGQALPPNMVVFDTMDQGRWATPLGKVPSLGELCFACDVEYDITQAHAADYDVDVMMQCFFTALRQGAYRLPPQLVPGAAA